MNKKIITSAKAPAPIGPYNQAVEAGGMLFVSGQIPLNQESGELVTGSIEDQTHQVMKNLGYILQEAGLGFSAVIKCSIFVQDLGNFGKINEVYGSYFEESSAPARETVEVSALPKNVGVEISCIAIRS